jgi:hypothetical protein
MPLRYNRRLTIALQRACDIDDFIIASFKYRPVPKKRRGRRCLKFINARAFIRCYTVCLFDSQSTNLKKNYLVKLNLKKI